MFSHWNKDEYHPNPALKAFQVFLLILIITGIGLLVTKDRWVPKLVNYILEREGSNGEQTSPDKDQNEHASQGDNRIIAAEAALLGEWQSTEDPHFVRIFKEEGEAIDEYREETVERQIMSWNVLTNETPDTELTNPGSLAYGPLEEGKVYLRLFTRGEGNIYFKLEKITPEELSMIYLGRGNILTFKKIK